MSRAEEAYQRPGRSDGEWRRGGSGYDRTGDRYDNRGGDRQDSWRRGAGGDNRGYDRDGGARRGGPRFGGDDRGPSSSSLNGSSSQRPRLNLQKRSVEDAASQLEKTELIDGNEEAAEGENVEANVDGEGRGDRPRQRERKFREPEVVNSRAAMLGEAAAPRKEVRHVDALTVWALFSFQMVLTVSRFHTSIGTRRSPPRHPRPTPQPRRPAAHRQ
jgi:hypothetical protein